MSCASINHKCLHSSKPPILNVFLNFRIILLFWNNSNFPRFTAFPAFTEFAAFPCKNFAKKKMTLVEAREFIQALTEQFQVNEDLAIVHSVNGMAKETAEVRQKQLDSLEGQSKCKWIHTVQLFRINHRYRC
jgi:hypothetical protein